MTYEVDSKVTQSPTGLKGGVIMDPKEQKLIKARTKASLKCDEASLKCDEAHCKWDEAHRKWAEAHRKLWEYQESKNKKVKNEA